MFRSFGWSSLVVVSLLGLMRAALTDEPAKPSDVRWLVRVEPVELGQRTRDELPAEVMVEMGEDRLLDPTNPSVTLATLGKAASALGCTLRIELTHP